MDIWMTAIAILISIMAKDDVERVLLQKSGVI